MFRITKRIIVEKFPGRDFNDIVYNLKLSWKYFKKFFYHVWWFRGRNYHSTLELLLLSLKEQHKTLKESVHEDYMTPINNLNKCVQLLDSIIEDDYINRCGYDNNYEIKFVPIDEEETLFDMKSTESDAQFKHNDDVRKRANQLKEEEEEMFFKLFKENYKHWWS